MDPSRPSRPHRDLAPLILILCVFIPLRVFLIWKHGVTVAGDGAPEAGQALGQFWLGHIPFAELASDSSVRAFLMGRRSQLLYPVLISFQGPIGWSIEFHILVLNTMLGAILVIASYFTALRLRGKPYAVLVALLMCSVTGLYWIQRYAVVDNLFHAMLPVVALAVLGWQSHKSFKTLVLMILAFVGFALTRPESMVVILAVLIVFFWNVLRGFFSRRVCGTVLLLSTVAVTGGTIVVVGSSPALQERLLSQPHIGWGLGMSANTFLNRGTTEFDALQSRYADLLKVLDSTYVGQLSLEDHATMMGRDAIVVIRANPLWFLLKIPLRALAFLFPWTYQPWSLPHRAYEALYTLFVAGGLVLLIRRARPNAPVLALAAIPLAIWLFLSVYGIDNDLKHRNGLLVALNLIAPLGYFLDPRSRPGVVSHG